MDLFDYREQIVAALDARLPNNVQVIGVRGRFTITELETYAVKAPSVMVAIITGTDADDRETVNANLSLVAFVLTKNGRAGKADAQGLKLATLVMTALKAGELSPESQRPIGIKFDNLYATNIGDDGVWLGAVSWKQLSPLEALPVDALAEFLKLFASYDLPPPDGRLEANDSINVRPPEPTP